jgi:hypothetical protein
MDDPPWRETMSMIAGRRRETSRSRQLLPDARQKIPANILKNNKNSSPGLFWPRVQRLEAVWHVRRRHCGLEIAG